MVWLTIKMLPPISTCSVSYIKAVRGFYCLKINTLALRAFRWMYGEIKKAGRFETEHSVCYVQNITTVRPYCPNRHLRNTDKITERKIL